MTETATDLNSGNVYAVVTYVTAANVAPTVTIVNPPTGGSEGSPLTLTTTLADLGTNDAPFTYAWTVTKNGAAFALPAGTAANLPALTFTPDGPGTFVASVSVTDKDGGVGTAAATVPVSNVAPTVNLGAGTTVTEGTVVSFGSPTTPVATDPGGAAEITAYRWTVVKQGDPTHVLPSTVLTTGATFAFQPVATGTYQVSCVATDQYGAPSVAGSATVIVNPTLTTATIAGPATVNEGATCTLSLSAANAGLHSVVSWSVNWGDGTAAVAYPGSATTATHVYADNRPASLAIVATATDERGAAFAATSNTLSVTVANVAPTAAVTGAPATSPEGTPVTLTAVPSDPSSADMAALFGYAWSVAKDGVPFALPGGTASATTLTFTPDGSGSFVATVVVTDKDCAASAPRSAAIAVTDVAPTVDLGPPRAVATGTPVSFAGVVTDPGAADVISYLWHVASNTGQVVADATTPTFSFTPTGDGTYAVQLTVTETNGGLLSGVGTTTVVTSHVALTAVFGQAVAGSVAEGSTVALAFANAVDHSSGATSGFTYSFDFDDDGNFASAGDVSGSASPSATHAFADDGTYVVHGRVTDPEGGSADYYAAVVVTNVAPTLVLQAQRPAAAAEGSPFTVALSASDPGADTIDHWPLNWGDGSAPQAVNGTPGTVAHVYTAAGPYTVTATATDEDGIWAATYGPNGIAITGLAVTVADVAPSFTAASLGGPGSLQPYQSLSRIVTFADPGAGNWTGTIDYGDGSSVVSLPNLSARSLRLYHAYAATGAYTVTVTATDRSGMLGAGAFTATVTGVAAGPVATITPAATAPVNSATVAFTRAVTGFSLANLSLTLDGGTGANLLTAGQTLSTADGGQTWTLSNVSAVTGAAGHSTLAFSAAGVTDATAQPVVADATAGWSVVAGGASTWTLPAGTAWTVRADPDGTHVDAWANATGTGAFAQQTVRSTVASIVLTGTAGTDAFVVDLSAGPLTAADGGAVTVAGNGGADRVTVVGTAGSDAVTATATGVTVVAGGRTTPVATGGAAAAFEPDGGTDAIAVAAGGTLSLAGGGHRAVVLSGLSVAATGKLDVGTNDLIVRGGSLPALTALVATGFAGGTWAGPGLTSSAAAADAAHLTAVGVVANLFASFDGVAVSAADVVVRTTVYGDANLDGVVTAGDYTRVDAGFVLHQTGWAAGDFNYDGVVDGSDYSLIDNAYNRAATSAVAAAPAAVAAAVAVAVAVPVAVAVAVPVTVPVTVPAAAVDPDVLVARVNFRPNPARWVAATAARPFSDTPVADDKRRPASDSPGSDDLNP